MEQFTLRTPSWGGRRSTEYFRLIFRNMLALANERTFIPAILPPGPSHIHTVVSIGTKSVKELLIISGLSMSLVYDFLVRSGGKGHLHPDDFGKLPLPELGCLANQLVLRTLLLNCLTRHYAPLWTDLYSPEFNLDALTGSDPRLPNFQSLTPEWSWKIPLRAPYARRKALIEIDVLAAVALGLSIEELIAIYRVQFAVLQIYENNTWYDMAGRIVFTANRGLSGVGLERKQFEEVRRAKPGDKLPDWAEHYLPPFTRCDREADYRFAYKEFSDLPKKAVTCG